MLGFGLISIAAHLATEQVAIMPQVNPESVAGDTFLFLVEKARDLVRLMFSALSGRYVVNLFQTAKSNSGYVLFVVVSAIVLLKMADHAMNTPMISPKRQPSRVEVLEQTVGTLQGALAQMDQQLADMTRAQIAIFTQLGIDTEAVLPEYTGASLKKDNGSWTTHRLHRP